jgi:GNAT superfamily N-acetyltransferase
MNLVNSRENAYEITAGIKKSSKDYITNFYPNDEKLNYWIESKVFYSKNVGNTVFFFRKDRDFYHLSFCAKNFESLYQSIKEISSIRTEIFVVDLVGTETSLKLLVNLFEELGFKKFVLYIRLINFISKDEVLPTASKDVVFPKLVESKIIAEMLEKTFDKYAEQIPTIKEIEVAINENMITIVRESSSIIGILMRDMAKFSSLWRFFLVSEKHRGKGVGSKLLNYYFNECKGKKIISWVLDINSNSLDLHKHYGFKFDSLRDQIMINRSEIFCQKNY